MAEPAAPPDPALPVDDATPPPEHAAVPISGADERARNEALRALFLSDPHFNTPDGLDAFAVVDCESERSAQGRQRQILRARALGLLDDELLDQAPDGPDEAATGPAPGDTAPRHEDP